MVLMIPVGAVAPEFAGVALWGGLVGGVVPDLDMVVAHRKTLHFPTYYSVLAGGSVVLALLVPTALTVAAMAALVGAAVHSVMDILGGGLSLRPWEATSDRAVYDHYRQHWYAPKRWVRYDGSPEGLVLTLLLGAVLWTVVDGALRWPVVASVVVAVVYTAVRRRLPTLGQQVVQRVLEPLLPNRLLRYLPAHLLSDRDT
nr:metal-dependent hydrolase [Halovenus carboxidivorans]